MYFSYDLLQYQYGAIDTSGMSAVHIGRVIFRGLFSNAAVRFWSCRLVIKSVRTHLRMVCACTTYGLFRACWSCVVTERGPPRGDVYCTQVDTRMTVSELYTEGAQTLEVIIIDLNSDKVPAVMIV